MAIKHRSPASTGCNDVIHSWTMDRPFSGIAWAQLTAAADGLLAAHDRFGPASRTQLRAAPLVFSVSCDAETITLRGGGVMVLAKNRLWLGGETLVIRRTPNRPHDTINTAGRPYEPVVRALLAMAVHFGSGFQLTHTTADLTAWRETERLVSALLGTEVIARHCPGHANIPLDDIPPTWKLPGTTSRRESFASFSKRSAF